MKSAEEIARELLKNLSTDALPGYRKHDLEVATQAIRDVRRESYEDARETIIEAGPAYRHQPNGERACNGPDTIMRLADAIAARAEEVEKL